MDLQLLFIGLFSRPDQHNYGTGLQGESVTKEDAYKISCKDSNKKETKGETQ